MSRHANIQQEDIFNSVVKIINNCIEVNFNIPNDTSGHAKSIGSGFFINTDSYVATAAHVVENSIELWINIPQYGKKNFKAEIVCVYPDFDLAIIRVLNYRNKHCLKLGNSDTINLRSGVYAIGYPSNSNYPIITSGHISGIRDDYMETDTPINSGNSGGPLLDLDNKVIGISSAVIENNQNSSLIVPINILTKNLKTMLHNKEKIIYTNSLGVVTNNGTSNYRKFYNIPDTCGEGVVIKKILKTSPLKAHLSEGDMICKFINSENTYDLDYYGEANAIWEIGKVTLNKIVKRCMPKEKVKIVYFSSKYKKMKTLTFNLKNKNEISSIKTLFPYINKIDYEIFAGIILMDLTWNHLSMPEYTPLLYQIKNKEIFDKQLVITHIYPNSKIAEYNLIKVYSIITKVNGIKTNSVKAFRKNIKKFKKKHYAIIETINDNTLLISKKEIILENKKISDYYTT
tara:strand:- start:6147 stop:7520 length:1374 start_codon:yes stop_codon:yes gene_type:complete